MLQLKDTVDLMLSDDFTNRFKAEYYQTKLRYTRLKNFNNTIELPLHDCRRDILNTQQKIMYDYLECLRVRAIIEGISLDSE